MKKNDETNKNISLKLFKVSFDLRSLSGEKLLRSFYKSQFATKEAMKNKLVM